jgi:hypothetical protein
MHRSSHCEKKEPPGSADGFNGKIAKEVWIWLGVLDKPMLIFLDWVQSFGNRITRDTSPEN